jgi:hypothetical protein
MQKLNHRPRKTLNYKIADKVFGGAMIIGRWHEGWNFIFIYDVVNSEGKLMEWVF